VFDIRPPASDIAGNVMKQTLQRIVFKLSTSAWVLFAFLFAVAFLLTAFHAFFPVTSAWDEHSHLSYVQYAFNWKIPREGDPLNTWAMAAFSCHPHEFFGAMTVIPCGEYGLPGDYPASLNTAAGWPPVYYFVTAVLMRIPLIVISDPLFAARLVTAFLWSLGVAWLGIQIFHKAKKLSLTIAFTMIAVSVSAVTAFASYVSPHALNPLLVAAGLFVSDRLVRSITEGRDANDRPVLAIITNLWSWLFVGYALLCALSIPQSMSVVLIFGLYVIVRLWQVAAPETSRGAKLWFTTQLGVLAVVPVFGVTYMWQLIQRIRTAPELLETATGQGSPAESAALTFHDIYGTFLARFWEFWPLSLRVEQPSGEFTIFIESFWLNILLGLSLGVILFWKSKHWLSALMLALFVVAPIMSTVFDFIFPFTVPKRYSLGIVIVGLVALGAARVPDRVAKALFGLAVVTYLLSYFLDPLKVDITQCAGSGSQILCRLFS
jgi:hypothetical protein